MTDLRSPPKNKLTRWGRLLMLTALRKPSSRRVGYGPGWRHVLIVCRIPCAPDFTNILRSCTASNWDSFDSISYYTAAAQRLLPDDVPTLLWARQLYVKAYGRTAYDRTWTDIMLTADLGIKLLEKHGLTSHPLYPKLLVTRGIGGKKYADGLTDLSRATTRISQLREPYSRSH